MKKTIILLIMLAACFNLKSQDQIQIGNIKFGKDKVYHAIAGSSISFSIILADKYVFERETNPIAPTLIAVTAGFGKEVFDSMTCGRFSGKDLIWTTVSAAAINFLGRVILKPQDKCKSNKKIDIIENYNPPLIKKN